MKQHFFVHSQTLSVISALFLTAPGLVAEPPAAAVSGFDSYSKTVETRLSEQHRFPDSFIAHPDRRLRSRELDVERLTTSAGPHLPGALLYHWRGTAFVPGGRASDFEPLMRDFGSYPLHFAPQVLQARVLSQDGDRVQAWMRIREHHAITVVMDTTYDVTFGRLDSLHGYSISRSTRIAEIDSPGTSSEHPLNATEEHGFLWRVNTYWSYEERDGGLYLQVEAVSLTRSIPRGIGWIIGPYVESIPRDSIEFTLRSVSDALRK